MKWRVRKSTLSGAIAIPPSKSHTIRALVIATLSKGVSQLSNILATGDGASAIAAAKSMGAEIEIAGKNLRVTGVGNDFNRGSDTFAMENSGTSTNLFASVAALGSRLRRFDGDESLRSRPFMPVLEALKGLGAEFGLERRGSDLPFWVRGPIRGGKTTVNGFSSQFVSSLLFACPCAPKDSDISVENLHERPYVEMTMRWLDRQGIRYEASSDLSHLRVFGGQAYKALHYTVPGDFSSATFAAVAAPLTGSRIALQGLDFSDSQGDKGVFDVLGAMGAAVSREPGGAVVGTTGDLRGMEIDLNAMPDALPAFCVLGCVAKGETKIENVAQARIKETDRIAVMAEELKKMGADIKEEKDGLTVKRCRLKGAQVNGRGDHRVVMALALAGMAADGETVVDTAEAAAVTYPTFLEDFRALGANIEIVE
ncbi:MAG TPA: 3-phosphoshikimate 1-carboxyvinyltransferase [Chitinivibrionales bacterium]|nr:3-phosphoshikimate 1-carboxyvinyltransferase [Chitinivibrionales bacterium]